MNERQRSESYLWGPCIFDVEAAKVLARQLPSHLIDPHRSMQGMRPKVPTDADLTSPIIFATFVKRPLPTAKVGAVMIDGNHRLAFALAHRFALPCVVLDPIATMHLCSGFSQFDKRDWKLLYKVADLLKLEWEPK